MVEEMDFSDIVVSVKASDVVMNYKAYMLMSEKTDYPLHIGVTESGDVQRGTIKSAAGLGALLLAGVGDTMRVSLTGDPAAEIPVAREILKCTGRLNTGINLISCPTCSRCRTALPEITERLMKRLESIEEEMVKNNLQGIDLAVMGCAVNGPGEASHADLGVACGDGKGVIFSKGHIISTVGENEIEDALVTELSKLIRS
jgi:(E)-4-hydroxy-3-methylbut-2-enyl-diphosphate synthase